MAGGAAYCSTCGLALREPERHPTSGPCPSCSQPLVGWSLDAAGPYRGGHPVGACQSCGGVWLPIATQRAMIESAAAEAERRGDALERDVVRQQLPVGILAAAVVYRRCPACSNSMARRNFGGCSGVIVDECRCGTFFDAGELEHVLTFVRTGGLQLAKRRADEERRRNLPAPVEQRGSPTMELSQYDPAPSFLRWLAEWLVRW